jgi:hypothetical protein
MWLLVRYGAVFNISLKAQNLVSAPNTPYGNMVGYGGLRWVIGALRRGI